MGAPQGFSWIEKPLLGALARPSSPEDFAWLRAQGVEVLLSLTEDRPRRDWTDAAGLLVFHEPWEDMEPPTQEQIDRTVSVVTRRDGPGQRRGRALRSGFGTDGRGAGGVLCG